MKHILKAKKRFLCLLLAGALAACLSPAALAAPDGTEIEPWGTVILEKEM